MLLLGLALAVALTPTSASFTDQTHSRTAHLAREFVPLVVPVSVGFSNNLRMEDTGLALTPNGDVYVWGLIGDRINGTQVSPTGPAKPTQVIFPANEKIAEVSGMQHDLNALDTNGCVWGWGGTDTRNGIDSTSSNRRSNWGPYKVREGTAWDGTGPELCGVTTITNNEGAGAALKRDGTVWYWGDDKNLAYSGNPGAGASQMALPRPAVYVRGAWAEFYVILDDGDVWYWGQHDPKVGMQNSFPAGTSATPTAKYLQALAPWMRKNAKKAGRPWIVAVDGGKNMGGALLSDGSILTWSNTDPNRTGHPADGKIDPTVLSLGDVDQLSYGAKTAIIHRKDGSLWCYGVAGDPNDTTQTKVSYDKICYSLTPKKLSDDILNYALGSDFLIWQTKTHEFYGIGRNLVGVLGLPVANMVNPVRRVDWNGSNELAKLGI
jgi:predicted ribosomally synthesized peptide with SipW-like signal peptide